MEADLLQLAYARSRIFLSAAGGIPVVTAILGNGTMRVVRYAGLSAGNAAGWSAACCASDSLRALS